MKRTDLPPQLSKILTEVPYVTLASVCPDGRPWNTPVWGCFDDVLNLYWASWPKNQHSQNVAHDPRIFVVSYDSRATEGDGLGIYMEMTAKMLTGKREIEQARKIYTTNFGEDLQHEPFTGKCPRRLYKATVQKIWFNSDAYIKGNFVDIRREVTAKR
ncbi:MAG TPA: pyridoxamine 5'-phosphate oxidase family protein [Candidatus Pristimantibacillus sp.]|nr:pyridoxamine 5'-phosphate oxidase family protein [Candidatus Pristimantibacillus sp.]